MHVQWRPLHIWRALGVGGSVELSCKAHVYAAGYEADYLYYYPERLAPRDSLVSCGDGFSLHRP
jgi:hypothetical protein